MSYWRAFAKKYPSQPLLRLDGGSIFSRGELASPIINRYILEGIYLSRLDALNVSASDIPVWQEMADLAASGLVAREFLNLPLVSSNLTPKVAGFPAFQPYILKEIKINPPDGKPLRLAITGLFVDPEERVSRKNFEVQEPDEAIRRVLGELRSKVDYVIVLADMGIGEAISLAITVPGINMLVVAHNYEAATDAQQVVDTLLIGPINQGRMITEARLGLKSGSQSVTIGVHHVPLDATIPDDPEMAELERKLLQAVSKVRNAQAADPGSVLDSASSDPGERRAVDRLVSAAAEGW